MNMETASLVLTTIAASLVFLIILLQLYTTIRPRFPSIVSCWFCGEKSKVLYNDRNSWDCVKCEQYNGFTPDGDYNKVIPAQHDIRLNSTCAVSRPTSSSYHSNGLCPSCNVNQSLKVQQLAGFVPFKASRYEEEVEEFAKHLDRIYALCYECEVTVSRELNKQRDWLTGLKIGAMRGKRWAEKQKVSLPSLLAFASKSSRAATVAISLTLFVASLLRPDVLPPTYWQLIPPEITGILESVTLEIRLLLLGVGSLVQLGGFFGRRNLKDVVAVILWMVANGIHWAVHLKVAEDFNHWEAVMTSTLFGCLLGSAVAAFTRQKTPTLVRRPIRAESSRNASQSAQTRSVSSQASGHASQSRAKLNAFTQPDLKKASAAEEISHLLHGTRGNISLPIGRQEKEEWPGRSMRSQEGLGQPMRSQEGLGHPMRSQEELGQPIRMHDGIDSGIGRLYIGQAAPRRPLVEPSRFDVPPPRNILHETDMFSALSRSSSQSSGFASQCSQHDDDPPQQRNPFCRPTSQRQHNLASPDYADFSRPPSTFGDVSIGSRSRFPNGASARSPAFSFHSVFENSGGKVSAASSQAGDDDFVDRSFRRGNRTHSGDFGSVRSPSFYQKSPGSVSGSVRSFKDTSPNSAFSNQTYRNSFESDSSFEDAASRNEMALVCANGFRGDSSVRSAGYGPVYLPPGFAPGYVVNHCCHHTGKLATGMIILGIVVNLILFASNSGLWPKVLDAFR